MALKAEDVVPGAFREDAGDSDDNANVELDLRNLTAFDSDPVDLEAFDKDWEGYLAESARRSAQCLIDRLFELPARATEAGPVAELPEATRKRRERNLKIRKEKAEVQARKWTTEDGPRGG